MLSLFSLYCFCVEISTCTDFYLQPPAWRQNFFVQVGTKIQVLRKIASKSFQELLIVLGCIEFLRSGEFYVPKLPFLPEKPYGKMGLQFGRNIFQKSEYAIFRMFITKNVEDAPLFG